MTPSIFMSCAASGDGYGGAMVERGVRYSMKGVDISAGRTRWFGRNLSASGFGVFSVWMKMVRAPRPGLESAGAAARARGARLGLCLVWRKEDSGRVLRWRTDRQLGTSVAAGSEFKLELGSLRAIRRTIRDDAIFVVRARLSP